MNERIQELADQAFDTAEYPADQQYRIEPNPAFCKKFAELIIKECAGIYDKIDNGNLHMGTDNYLEALQKHFGVEE